MKITSVEVHNYRSIADCKFELSDYSLVIGANNCGKSNFVDAIRAFYDEPRFDESNDLSKFECDGKCWIDVEFELTDDEYASLAEQYRRPKNRLKVRKIFGTYGGMRSGIYGYSQEDVLLEEHFYGARNVQQGKLGKPIYIPAASKLDEHTKLTGPSALRDLLQEVLKKVLAYSTSYGELVEQFSSFSESFKAEKTEDERSLSGLEDEINAELEDWEVRFNLNVEAVSIDDLMKRLLSYSLEDRVLQQGLHPERYGHGLQRHLIYTLIRLAATHSSDRQPKDKRDFSPELTLILFEEPEAFLHPAQQLVLYQNLRTLSEQEGYQVLVTSHSPYFVSYNVDDIPSILRLHRDKQTGKTLVGQLTPAKLNGIITDNRQINLILNQTQDLRLIPEKEELEGRVEALRYFLWLDPERCGLFFADHVLLVEGPTERVLFNYLLKSGHLTVPHKGLFILDCLTKFNIHRFMNLLGNLSIPHSIICDKDSGRLQKGVNRLIQDSANSYTMRIEFLTPDLEGFLGVEKPEHRHRKPESLMLKLSKGQLPGDRLAALVDLVTDACIDTKLEAVGEHA